MGRSCTDKVKTLTGSIGVDVKIQFLNDKMKTLTGSIGVDVDLSEIRNSLIHAHTYIDHINERYIMLKSNC